MNNASAAEDQDLFEATGTDGGGGAVALRRVASERLAAHRQRRADVQATLKAEVTAAAERQALTRTRSQQGSSRVREAVAARYQKSVSYREFLAQEAAIALEKARAEAEVATRNVQAVQAVQTQLLEEIEQWTSDAATAGRDAFTHAIADIAVAATASLHLEGQVASTAATATTPAELTVRLYEDLRQPGQLAPVSGRRLVAETHVDHEDDLDAEIAFRLAPEFEPLPAPTAFTGNVIEFPRPLVAARKARPRLAEGPLLTESVPVPQLRIFEVEADQFSTEPAPEPAPATAPGWQSLVLDAAPQVFEDPAALRQDETQSAPALTPAALSLRAMAFAVDGAIVVGASLAAACTVAKLSAAALPMLPLPILAASAAAMLLTLAVIYPLLFFSLNEATPGMRYARLAYCTFADAVPSRSAARRRVFATALAASPLGLGILWACMDDEHLGWHDRISRIYLRAY